MGLAFFFLLAFFFFFSPFSLFEASTSKAASAAWLQVLGAKGPGHLLMGAGGAQLPAQEEQSRAQPSLLAGARRAVTAAAWYHRC